MHGDVTKCFRAAGSSRRAVAGWASRNSTGFFGSDRPVRAGGARPRGSLAAACTAAATARAARTAARNGSRNGAHRASGSRNLTTATGTATIATAATPGSECGGTCIHRTRACANASSSSCYKRRSAKTLVR